MKKFETEEDCEKYIQAAMLTETIVLIASEALAKNVVPCVHQQCQLAIVFVYQDDEESDKQWISKYKKVKKESSVECLQFCRLEKMSIANLSIKFVENKFVDCIKFLATNFI